MTGALDQLQALLVLRWQMSRSPGLRVGIVLAALVVGWLVILVAGSGDALDPAALATAVELAPVAYLGFGALAVIAPLTAGGGNEVVPPDQLVALPVRPATQFLGGLLLAPLNLVWVIQLLVLVALTSYLTLDGSALRGGVTTGAYVAGLTVAGQTLAWLVVGLRHTQAGRRVVGGLGITLLGTAVLVIRTGHGRDLLDASPTRSVVAGVVAGGGGQLVHWGVVTGVLLAGTAIGLGAGVRTCAWALRRPGDAGHVRHSQPVRRRAAKAGALRELVAVDRASVWRAPALRRGGLVLAILPGLIAAGTAVPWESMIVLPGLVAAGAGLLFGVNAFCLDGSGAVWLASLPHDPRLVARAKALVLAETVLAATVVAALAGSLRSPGSPTGSQLAAIVASGLACTAVVVAGALKMSVRRPHRAELRGPRDAVAPPGALAVASARLAVPVAVVGVLLGAASQAGIWWWPPLLALPVLLLAGLSVLRSLRRYADPTARAGIVQAVAHG
ncbi:MAG: hypothetical protein WD794_05525 [Mycobacteriales bacterium]